jgi:Terminase small subunit
MAKNLLLPTTEFGPEMRKLFVVEQMFVCMLFNGATSATKAAELAGVEADTRANLRVKAHRMLRNPLVIAAIKEEAQRRTVALLPRAQMALANLIENPHSEHHFKAINTVRSESGLAAVVKKVIDVNVNVTDKDKLKAIELFAKNHGIDPKTLLGFDPHPTTDAEFEEIEPETSVEDDMRSIGL